MKIAYLDPRGPFKNELHSDTLFGLLCWAIRQVFSEAQLVGLLSRFKAGEPPFLISSAFPYRQEGERREHFLPRPLLRPASFDGLSDREEMRQRKEFKRARWILADQFAEFLQGRLTEQQYYESGAWKSMRSPRVRRVDRLRSRIDRLSGTTDGEGILFASPEYWVEGGGLYFLLKGPETEIVEKSLAFLEDFGWGGGNAAGYGQFRTRVEEGTLFAEAAEPNRFVTLSLYHPTAAELAHYQQGEIWYELVRRKGKVGGHFLQAGDFWKRSMLMFAPGSTFPLIPGHSVYGDNPIAKGKEDGLPFEVQQFGYAFTAAMKAATE